MTTAIEKPNSDATQLKGWLNSDKFKTEVARMLPAHLKSERFIRVALNAALTTPKLAECTKLSVFKCLLDLAALGIEPNGRDAHLIPYRDNRAGVTTCTLIVDFKGLVQIVRRAPGVSSIHADVVRANDNFEFQHGVNAFLRHSYPLADRGKIVGAYSHVNTKHGESFVVLTLDEIEEVRRASRSGTTGPWKTHFAEMAKKTAFRRHTKWLELPSEVSRVIEQVDPEKPIDQPRRSDADTIDLGAPAPAQIEEGEAQDDDNLPMNFDAQPAAESKPATKPAKTTRKRPETVPQAARTPQAREYTEKDADALRAEFVGLLVDAGATFSDFQAWATETGMIPDAAAMGSADDMPVSELARCVNASAGLIAQLRDRKEAGE